VLGCATRLPLDVLSELRFKRMDAAYAEALAALTGRPTAIAAE